MIARILRWLEDSEARDAARFLQRHRQRREREMIKAMARQLRLEGGLPPHPALER